MIQSEQRESHQNYLRTLAGLLARAVTGAKKGSRKGRFWDGLAWSRVVSWTDHHSDIDFANIDFESIARELEAAGVWRTKWSHPPPLPRLKP